MIRLCVPLLILALSTSAIGGEISDIATMSKMAKAEVLERYRNTNSANLVLVGVSLEDKPKQLSKNFLNFQFLDKGKHTSDEISKYVYTTYWVSFSLVTGRIVDVGPSTYGTYKPIASDDYYH